MARYNRFNHGIKLNHKVADGGGIFNYRVFGYVGQIISTLSAAAIPHLLKRTSSVVSATASFTGKAHRIFRRSASIVISAVLSGSWIRKRRSKTDININLSATGKAKRNIFASAVTSFVLSLIARLRQKYRPVFPRLELTEYKVGMEYVDYPIAMEHIGYCVLMEVVGMPYAGSTVTLKGTFPDSAGNLTQLDDVTLKVYGPGKVLVETIIPTEISTGLYSGDFTIPADKVGQFDYEFSGVLGDKTIVGRSSFQSLWR